MIQVFITLQIIVIIRSGGSFIIIIQFQSE